LPFEAGSGAPEKQRAERVEVTADAAGQRGLNPAAQERHERRSFPFRRHIEQRAGVHRHIAEHVQHERQRQPPRRPRRAITAGHADRPERRHALKCRRRRHHDFAAPHRAVGAVTGASYAIRSPDPDAVLGHRVTTWRA
jgi:hypothetical protein